MGSVRHIADIRADDMAREGQDHIQLQSGTNKYASQKGMSMGAVRHIADIRADDLCREGMDHVQLQSGWSALQQHRWLVVVVVLWCGNRTMLRLVLAPCAIFHA